MTPDDESFLRAIADAPEEDTHRLVYADHVAEAATAESEERAALIRRGVLCECYHLSNPHGDCFCCHGKLFVPRCEHDGCRNAGRPCFLPATEPLNEPQLETVDPRENPDHWYCGEHCQSAGFCVCCGEFWGGIESFDGGSGVCEYCQADAAGNDDVDDWDLESGYADVDEDWD